MKSPRMVTRVRTGPLSALFVLAIVAAACNPAPGASGGSPTPSSSGPVVTDISKLGPVTLTVWDQEVRGGQAAEITQLNKEFQETYPNVTIKRVAKSFTDLITTVKLGVSGKNPPDVVEANQGWGVMGELVKAKLLRPLDDYASAYRWDQRYSQGLLDLNSFSSDGSEFGTGSLYGVSQTGELLGVYYNKQKLSGLGVSLPQTFGEFEQDLAKAKAGGEIPIQFGNLDKWPGIHEFGMVQDQLAPKAYVRDLVFGRSGATFDAAETTGPAARLVDWVNKGYFTPGFNGLGYDDSWKQFGEGKGVFLITGSWLNADLTDAMGDNVGFFLMPPANAGDTPVATGGEGLAWSITSATKHPEVAAAYLDFITNEHAAEVLVNTGNLPALPMENPSVKAGSALADVFAAWKTLTEGDGLVPYLDYTTPTFYDTVTASIQELMAEKSSPQEFAQSLQADFAKFHGSA